MTHNLATGPDADANHTLSVLRAATLSQPLVSDQPLVPGVWINLDPEGRTKGRVESAPGQIARIVLDARRPGRWAALHVDLGACDLTGRLVLGLVARLVAPRPLLMRAAIRSGGPEGFVDTFFPKRVLAFDRPSVHLDTLRLTEAGAPPARSDWSQLVIFLETQSHEVGIEDLRLFSA